MSDTISTAPRPLVLGTAGHVDHGKTSLIFALTGIDTDRLKEEKERGITIELGFAHLDLPGSEAAGQHRLGIVDVPGHERFVRAMVAGATGIDLVLLVVAADEGVMPQTREHLNICSFLGVRHGLVVLTKVDMVDEEWLELVEADVEEALEGTFLEGAKLLRFSAVDPELCARGIEDVRHALEAIAARLGEQRDDRVFRLPVDRVFTMRGFGTVVTGTCASGRVSRGESVEVLPRGVRGRLRGIQAHGQSLSEVRAGQRAALNLQGIELSEVLRGDVVVRKDTLRASSMLDVRVRMLPHLPDALGPSSRVLLHLGTAQVEASLLPLDRDEIGPGETGLVQLRLARPVVALPGDRFILRGFARDEQSGATVGGGQVLLANPPRRRRRSRRAAVEVLERIEQGGTRALLEEILRQAWIKGLGTRGLGASAGLVGESLAPLVDELVAAGAVLRCEGDDNLLVHREACARLAERASAVLRRFHREHPRKEGMDREELLSRLPELGEARSPRCLLDEWVRQGEVVLRGRLVRLTSFEVRRDPAIEELKSRILALLAEHRLTPPRSAELASSLDRPPELARELLGELVQEGRVVRVKEDLHIGRSAMEDLQARLVRYLQVREEISPTEFKAMVGGSRRFSIPLAEHFDRCKLTLRVGDMRRLRGPG